MLDTAPSMLVCIAFDIEQLSSKQLSCETNLVGLAAKGIQGERSMLVPVGLSGGAAGMLEKMTVFAKFARLREVLEEKIPKAGPYKPASPGTS